MLGPGGQRLSPGSGMKTENVPDMSGVSAKVSINHLTARLEGGVRKYLSS